ncbi:ABC transporter permease [Candidatus Bipolaricaulota bacterium]|nr:ABC transporter permease [Candidatus Bipolaricaulota bacterium]
MESRLQASTVARRALAGLNPVLESLLAGVLGLLVGALLMKIWGYDPWKAYHALFVGAYGDSYGLASSLARGTPLILTALTFSICVRAGMFNIGAEGQVYLGAMAAVTVGYFSLPPGLHLIVGLLFAIIAGAIWSLGPAILKITRGVHEVISTIMFNWISHFLCYYLVANVLVDPIRGEKTISVPRSARFPILMRGTDLSYSLFAAVAFALVIYFILWHTVTGYEVRAAGLSPTAARYGGISSKRTMLLGFILGGMGAGLAGACIVMGLPPTYAEFSGLPQISNLGFDGMAVAMVGRTHPIGILVAAVFFGGLTAGGRTMQITAGVPLEMVRVVEGVIVTAMAIPELVRLFRFVWRRSSSLFAFRRAR